MGKGNRNSQKRAEEQLLNADKLIASQKAQNKKSARDKAVSIALSVIAIIVVVTIAFSTLSSTGIFMRNTNVVSSETVKVDAAMMSFFLNDHIINWYNSYSGYMSLFSVDLSKDLRTQTYGDTSKGYAYETYFLGTYDGTWYDYFLDTVKGQVEMYVVYATEAQKLTKEGVTDLSLTDENKAEIDEIIKSIKSSLTQSNATFSDWYGKGVKESDVRRCYELIYLASNFATYFQEKLEAEITDDEIVDYRENNKSLFYTADCLVYSISKTSKGMTDAEYDKACAEAKAAADAIAEAKTPAEFIELIEKYEASLKETNKETTGSDTESDTESDTNSETDTETNTDTETESYTESEAEIDSDSDTETEKDISSKVDKYKDTIEYVDGTGNELNDFLFGNDETGSDRIEAAEEGDKIVIEETGTTTEKITTAKTESNKVENNKKNVETTETDSDESETKKEETTTAKKDYVTYETYKVTAYFVIDPMHFDTELTHDFAYLVSDEKANVFEFSKVFGANTEKTLDLFVENADTLYEKIHSSEDHKHSSDEMFEYNKLEKQAASAFGTDYKVLNEWVESADRTEKQLSDIIEIKIVSTDSTTGKTTTKTQYGILFFDKHSEETWYVSASAGAVSENFQEWYEAWLEKSPLKIDKSALSSIETVKFYAY